MIICWWDKVSVVEECKRALAGTRLRIVEDGTVYRGVVWTVLMRERSVDGYKTTVVKE